MRPITGAPAAGEAVADQRRSRYSAVKTATEKTSNQCKKRWYGAK